MYECTNVQIIKQMNKQTNAKEQTSNQINVQTKTTSPSKSLFPGFFFRVVCQAWNISSLGVPGLRLELNIGFTLNTDSPQASKWAQRNFYFLMTKNLRLP